MDPLIRKVNSDNEIEGLNIGINGEYIDKVCGYADDIVFIIKECSRSIENLFKTYHNFSKISGIELNTEKTEILRIGDWSLVKVTIITNTIQQLHHPRLAVDLKSPEQMETMHNAGTKIANDED
jgi:hypothetical protein